MTVYVFLIKFSQYDGIKENIHRFGIHAWLRRLISHDNTLILYIFCCVKNN